MGVPAPIPNGNIIFSKFSETVNTCFLFPQKISNSKMNELYIEFVKESRDELRMFSVKEGVEFNIDNWIHWKFRLWNLVEQDNECLEKPMHRSSLMNTDNTHRYYLIRVWDNKLPIVNFIMLNPSSANSEKDDPTTRKLIHYCNTHGYGGFVVTNLCSFKTAKPTILISEYMNGENVWNDETNIWINYFIKKLPIHIVCYGNNGTYFPERIKKIKRYLKGLSILSFGLSKRGFPMHPLFLKKKTKLIEIEL